MSEGDNTAAQGGIPGGHPLLPMGSDELATMSKLQIVQVALKHSLAIGSFVDTKLYAFSRRRDGTGIVDRPLPVYANSAMLRVHSSYFDGFFNGGFSEARVTSLREGFPEEKDDYSVAYDYDTDSDLEEDLETNEGDLPSANVETRLPSVGPAVFPYSDTEFLGEHYGRVAVIPDVSHRTLKAMVYFLYTGELDFAPLTSSSTHAQSSEDSTLTNSIRSPWAAPQCSPKSMYRLADKFGLSDLKVKARENIVSKLTTDNISTELRSSLTSIALNVNSYKLNDHADRYDEIREIMVNFACERSRLPIILSIMPEWLEELATGNIPHAATTIATLISKVTTIPPPVVSPSVPHCSRVLYDYDRFCLPHRPTEKKAILA
ncbi:hypothetical protein BDY19DRAFT_906358 [Irpex rosettiformis]|uniref:Uncharacterized protein n=1 Tax=Irpex rosettiformis TaxID=378272 RepID=A0ACB8U3K3_9APHY|nr:hypothetical protein BDY19DRAFT_906358 [Irpex rosettiformis]